MQREFCNLAENFDLLTRKDIFPYEYIDCVEKLKKTILPPANYSTARLQYLRMITRTPSTCGAGSLFEPSANIANIFISKNRYLVVDIFENFRDSCVASYRLNPAYYYISGFYMGC